MRDGKLVYSTDPRVLKCLTCGQFKNVCKCVPDRASKPPQQQDPRVRLEKGGRGGKAVTVVTDLELSNADLTTLLKELKNKCACGGTLTEGTLEIQGDQRDKVVDLLVKKGYKAKKAGG